MKHKFALYFAVALLTIGLSSAAAHADSVIFSLTNPTQHGAGSSFTYTATVSAPAGNSGTEFLNGDSFNIDVPLGLDDTDFFVNFPFFLNPGDTFTGDLFTLNIPAGTPLGTYSGTFTLLGGADGGAGDVLGIVNYSVTVTPEPSSFLLLGTGMTGVIAAFKRRRFIKV